MLTNLTITMTTVSATRSKRTGEMSGKITSSKRSRVKRTGEMRKIGGGRRPVGRVLGHMEYESQEEVEDDDGGPDQVMKEEDMEE